MRVEVSENELRHVLESEQSAERAIHDYFEVDPKNAFSTTLRLKPNVHVSPSGVEEFSPGTTLLKLANSLTHKRRMSRYRTGTSAFPYRTRVVAQGDSWFQHPLMLDTLDHLSNHLNVYSIAAAGDELQSMFRKNEYEPALEHQESNFLLLSGGGNDLLGMRFSEYLVHFDGQDDPADLLNSECTKKISDVRNIYSALLLSIAKNRPDVNVLVHGYDYVVPGIGNGRWLLTPMLNHGISSPKLQKSIVKVLIDRFNSDLQALAAEHPNLSYVNARNSVGATQWADEIHPDSSGFQQVAIRFLKRIAQLRAA
jgi:hypothetical protein